MKNQILLISSAMALVACGPSYDAAPQADNVDASETITVDKLAGFSGEYVVVDARRASDVAAPLDTDEEPPIGETVSFVNEEIRIDGISCDAWLIEPATEQILPWDTDPNLIDLRLPPTDGPNSAGDQQEHVGFSVSCEGEPVAQLHRVDDRVLVMPWSNSSVNLILEKSLTPSEVRAYQAQLKSMKFYEGEATGTFDEPTLRASRAWYEYRADTGEPSPVPARPTVTENLLDGLDVIES